MDAARELFNQFDKRGIKRIQQSCERSEEESGILEFKEFPTSDFGRSPKQVREQVLEIFGEALSAFGNAQGGVLVWGIEAKSEKADKPKAAVTAKPIPQLGKFVAQLNDVVHRMAIPAMSGVVIKKIPESRGKDSGFVVIFVPPAHPRPRQSGADNVYYMRSGSSTVAMPHDIVQALFLARSRPVLEVSVAVEAFKQSPTGIDLIYNVWRYRVKIILTLHSIGEVLPTNVAVMLEHGNGPTKVHAMQETLDVKNPGGMIAKWHESDESESPIEVFPVLDSRKMYPGVKRRFYFLAYDYTNQNGIECDRIRYRLLADGFQREGSFHVYDIIKDVEWQFVDDINSLGY